MACRVPAGPATLPAATQGLGLTVLCLPGLWCAQRFYAPLAESLDGTGHWVGLDWHGHGGRRAPRGDWGLREAAAEALALLDALAIPRALVVGHSLGGMAALHLALDHPGRVAGLVLMGASPAAETPERRSRLEAAGIALRLAGPRPAWITRAAEALFGDAFRRHHPAAVEAWCREVRGMTGRALAQSLGALAARPDITRRLGEVAAPTVVLAGTADMVFAPEAAAALARALPAGRLVEVPGAGHGLPLENPGVVAREAAGLAAVLKDRG